MNRIPASIITGFLGSGKTTLLNRLLNEKHGIRFAVIINEFGDIGLDGSLVSGTQDFVEMSNGCLCCVLNDDLVKTLEKIHTRNDIDAIVVETTGIADPLQIGWTFGREEFVDTLRFAAIITVVDPLHLTKMLDAGPECREQIERADYVYFSKTDIARPEQISEAQKCVRQFNPQARFTLANDAHVINLLFDTENTNTPPQNKPTHAHHNYESISIDLTGKLVDDEKLEIFFENLPEEIFRAKAIFKSSRTGRYHALHAVCGRIDFVELDHTPDKQAAVFIGNEIDKNELLTAFKIGCTPKE